MLRSSVRYLRRAAIFLSLLPRIRSVSSAASGGWIKTWHIPVISLRKFYHIPGTPRIGSEIMAYIKGSTRELCIVADRVADQGSLVEKSLPAILGKHFKKYTGISGCSLLGDGTIRLQLDIEDLARNTGGGKTHE